MEAIFIFIRLWYDKKYHRKFLEDIMTPIQWMILGAAILAVILLLILALCLIQMRNRKLGIDGKRKVAAILKRFAGIRSFRVLNDLTLKTPKHEVKIDHVLIGFFGILVVNTKNLRGAVYGDGRGKNWTNVITKKEKEIKSSFPNPLLENQLAVEAIREVLSSNNVYKVSIESYVVFTRRKTSLYVPKGIAVLSLKDFRKLLKRSKYSADGDVDVKKVAEVLTNSQTK